MGILSNFKNYSINNHSIQVIMATFKFRVLYLKCHFLTFLKVIKAKNIPNISQDCSIWHCFLTPFGGNFMYKIINIEAYLICHLVQICQKIAFNKGARKPCRGISKQVLGFPCIGGQCLKNKLGLNPVLYFQ
jgi:hypothetical protein